MPLTGRYLGVAALTYHNVVSSSYKPSMNHPWYFGISAPLRMYLLPFYQGCGTLKKIQEEYQETADMMKSFNRASKEW